MYPVDMKDHSLCEGINPVLEVLNPRATISYDKKAALHGCRFQSLPHRSKNSVNGKPFRDTAFSFFEKVPMPDASCLVMKILHYIAFPRDEKHQARPTQGVVPTEKFLLWVFLIIILIGLSGPSDSVDDIFDTRASDVVLQKMVLVKNPNCFQTRRELQSAIALYTSENVTMRLEAFVRYGRIGQWCVSKIEDFSELFKGRETFNEPLDGWDVRQRLWPACFKEQELSIRAWHIGTLQM